MIRKQDPLAASFFVIGLRNGEKQYEEAELKEEMRINRDFIVGNFVDSYRNLTLKTLTSYTYFEQYCDASKTQWIILNDDDTFVDQRQLDRFLPSLPTHSRYQFES